MRYCEGPTPWLCDQGPTSGAIWCCVSPRPGHQLCLSYLNSQHCLDSPSAGLVLAPHSTGPAEVSRPISTSQAWSAIPPLFHLCSTILLDSGITLGFCWHMDARLLRLLWFWSVFCILGHVFYFEVYSFPVSCIFV